MSPHPGGLVTPSTDCGCHQPTLSAPQHGHSDLFLELALLITGTCQGLASIHQYLRCVVVNSSAPFLLPFLPCPAPPCVGPSAVVEVLGIGDRTQERGVSCGAVGTGDAAFPVKAGIEQQQLLACAVALHGYRGSLTTKRVYWI